MPTAEAQLIISCKATGQKVIDDFNKSMQKLDQQAEKTLKKLADVEKQLERMKSAGGNIAASGIGGNSTGRIGQRAHGLEDIRAKAKQIEDYITKTHGGISKSINGVDTQCKNLAKSATVATVATKKLSGSFISGKIAGRLFGFEVSNTSKELTQIAIIAKGIESAVKIAQFAGNKYLIEPFESTMEELKRNFASAEDIGSYETARDQRFLSYFRTLQQLNAQEKLFASDRLKMKNIIEDITKSFKGYNFIIDETTGKIKNLNELEVKFVGDSHQRAIKNTRRMVLSFQEQERVLRETINGAREQDLAVKKWMKRFSIGGDPATTTGKFLSIAGAAANAIVPGAGLIFSPSDEKSIDRRYEALANILTGGKYSETERKASEELSAIIAKRLKFEKLLKDLESSDPATREAAKQEISKLDAIERRNFAFEKTLAGLKRESELTRLIVAGRKEEAERLRTLYMFQSKLPGLSAEQYKQLTDQALLSQKLLADQRAQAETARFLLDIQKQATGYKSTSVSAISANSMQAALLQSRQLINPKNPVEELKTVVIDLKKIISLLSDGKQNSGEIKTLFEKLKISTY